MEGDISDNKINVSINRSLRSILNVKFANYNPKIPTKEMYLRLNILKFKDLCNFFSKERVDPKPTKSKSRIFI